jgi:hypothetical protein
LGYSSKMNSGQRLRQRPKRKPLLVNLSSDDEDVQFVQQSGPSGTRQNQGTSRGRGQGQGLNKGQIRPNFGYNYQNKNLPSTSLTEVGVCSEDNLHGLEVNLQPARVKFVLWQLSKSLTTTTKTITITAEDRRGRTAHLTLLL